MKTSTGTVMASTHNITALKGAVILIPAYQPDKTLAFLVSQIINLYKDQPSFHIVIIDDGSSPEAGKIFDTLKELSPVTVLSHKKNKGKGAALKTGFQYILKNIPDATAIVTADADGQHLPKDIMVVANKTISVGQPVLGMRTFGKDVPFKSRFGNNMTKFLFTLIFKTKVPDTQTGLRGLPIETIEDLVKIEANGYDFEFEGLIYLIKKYDVFHQPIETVYEPGNPTSHFDPLRDSAKVYFVFLRHLSAILIAGLLDFILFSVLLILTNHVMTSLFLGRSISVVVYFLLAKNMVFQVKDNLIWQVSFFAVIVTVNLLLLWPFIIFMHDQFTMPRPIAMILGNIILFVFNFIFMKYIVFQKGRSI